MFQINKNISNITAIILLLLPISSFSDGGLSTHCTSYKLYNSQPTILKKYKLVIKSLKINGIKIPNFEVIKEINGINNIKIPRSDMDNLYINDMVVSQDNASITKVYFTGGGGEYFSFVKK